MIYRKEEYVQDRTDDRKFPIKQVDCLTPVDGSGDRFIGRAVLNMQTPVGIQQVPVSFEIAADSVEDAFRNYNQYAEPKVEEVKQRIQQRLSELRQQEHSRIVTPGQGASGGSQIINFDDLKGES